MKHTYTINDGLRTVGQLLLHRPAVGAYAYDRSGHAVSQFSNRANTFCYAGAIRAVSNELHLNSMDLFNAARSKSECAGVFYWDGVTDAERRRFATQLAAVTEP